jgi:hypothetical protein
MSRGRNVRGLVIAALVAASLLAPSPASSATRPPEVTFVTASDSETAFVTAFCWGEYDPPLTYHECAGGDMPVPPGRRMPGLSSVHLRVDHPQEPDRVELVYWKGSEWRRPKNPRVVDVTTRPSVDGSGVAWVIDFELPRRWNQLSLELEASWEAEVSCPTCGRQWGRYRVTLVK